MKIEKKNEILSVDYSDESIYNFCEKNIKSNELKKQQLGINSINELLSEPQYGDIIYIFSNKIDMHSLKENYNNAISKGAIIYIVCHTSYNFKEFWDKTLIRKADELPNVSFVLKESSNLIEGLIFNGDIEVKNNSVPLYLDEIQSKDMKSYFSNSFWNRCSEELMGSSEEPEEAISMYSGFFYNNIYESKDYIIDYFEDFLIDNRNNKTIYNDLFNYSNFLNSSLILSKYTNLNLELISKLNSSNSIYLTKDNIYNNFFISEEEGYFISDMIIKDNSFILKLNDEQLKEFKEYFDILILESDYKYHSQLKLRNIKNEFFYINSNKNIYVKENIDVKLNPIIFKDINEFINFDIINEIQKQKKFNPLNPALKYNFSLDIIPPYLPKGAEKSKLVKDWENLDTKYNRFIQNNIEKLNKFSNELNNTKGINLFKKFKQLKINKDIKNLEKLNIYKLSNLPQERCKQLIDELYNISKVNQNNKVELEYKIKEDQWNEKKEKLYNLKKQNNLEKKELEENLKILKNKFQNEKQKKLNKLSVDILSDLEKKISSSHENLKLLNESLLEIEKINLKKQKELEESLKALKVNFSNKISDYILEILEKKILSSDENLKLLNENLLEIEKINSKNQSNYNNNNRKFKKKKEKTNYKSEVNSKLIILINEWFNNLSSQNKQNILNELKIKSKNTKLPENIEISKLILSVSILIEKTIEKTNRFNELKQSFIDNTQVNNSSNDLKNFITENSLTSIEKELTKFINNENKLISDLENKQISQLHISTNEWFNKFSSQNKQNILNELKLKTKNTKLPKNTETSKLISSVNILIEKTIEKINKFNKSKQLFIDNIQTNNNFDDLKNFITENPLTSIEKELTKFIDDQKKQILNIENKIKIKNDKASQLQTQINTHGTSFNETLKLNDEKKFDTILTIPNEELNRIGNLFELNSQRYLRIEKYSELEIGKVEAEKLNAIICVNSF